MALHAKYHGLILYDNETRASHKLFRIASIQFVRSYSKARHNCWEATCEPVYFCNATNAFIVPQDKQVEGSNGILASALVGHALTEYPNGMEEEPAHLPWVDNYIAHFKNVVEPSCLARLLSQTNPWTLTLPHYPNPYFVPCVKCSLMPSNATQESLASFSTPLRSRSSRSSRSSRRPFEALSH